MARRGGRVRRREGGRGSQIEGGVGRLSERPGGVCLVVQDLVLMREGPSHKTEQAVGSESARSSSLLCAVVTPATRLSRVRLVVGSDEEGNGREFIGRPGHCASVRRTDIN